MPDFDDIIRLYPDSQFLKRRYPIIYIMLINHSTYPPSSHKKSPHMAGFSTESYGTYFSSAISAAMRFTSSYLLNL
jgi:uncharacterized sporulation protein YeaH/YhbH (DUF444 family)